ncbi:DUF1289 domain-containing protein [Roseibium sp. RKSG952]|uniref:DUF1289 domain-containing protein n=1 Tax=Roseibium sp. RKSG952 TaxID=2529384 RepID=UPI0012BC7D77|nr:DUF1289 domain-containing protein [Roseibium sp. RKSG952]MTH95767.1 DUF1289 domain-containing protein [Roseibium sp. RKSG952]
MTSVSPCVGLCKIDATTGLCMGCARTRDEIADWCGHTEAWRAEIWKDLPERFERLGVTCRRLPWETEDIRNFVLRSLSDGRGTWVAGVVGAVGEFTAAPGQAVRAEHDGEVIVSSTRGAGLRFRIDDNVRALTFEAKETPLERSRIVLAVKQERGHPDIAHTLTALGPDLDAVAVSDRDAHVFDLGMGRKEARFCVRAGPGETREALSSATGSAFPDNLGLIAPALLANSPARVIETALGRIEILTPIPPPGGQSPLGPHTHLLPAHLATGKAMPAGMDLPGAYLPGAIFYPAD